MIRTRETNLEVNFTRIPPSLTILFYCLALTPLSFIGIVLIPNLAPLGWMTLILGIYCAVVAALNLRKALTITVEKHTRRILRNGQQLPTPTKLRLLKGESKSAPYEIHLLFDDELRGQRLIRDERADQIQTMAAKIAEVCAIEVIK